MQNNTLAGRRAAGSHCQAGTVTPGRANVANKSCGLSLLGLRLFNGPGIIDSPGAAGQNSKLETRKTSDGNQGTAEDTV
jgi:hypothetical protein